VTSAIRLRDPLPVVKIPLRGTAEFARLDLQAVLDIAYGRGAFDALIDSRREPLPPLRPADATRADKLLRKAKLRRAKRTR